MRNRNRLEQLSTSRYLLNSPARQLACSNSPAFISRCPTITALWALVYVCVQGCDVTYTLSKRSNFVTYPLDYKRGQLNLDIVGNGNQSRLTWDNPANATSVLVSQINVNKAEAGANGYERNQVFTDGTSQFAPVITDTSTNYAFVVQAFNQDNDLIGYQAIIMDLPQAL